MAPLAPPFLHPALMFLLILFSIGFEEFMCFVKGSIENCKFINSAVVLVVLLATDSIVWSFVLAIGLTCNSILPVLSYCSFS